MAGYYLFVRDFNARHKVSIKIYKISIGLNIGVNLEVITKRGLSIYSTSSTNKNKRNIEQPSTHQVIRMSFSSVPQFSLSLGLPATRDGVLVYIQYWNPR